MPSRARPVHSLIADFASVRRLLAFPMKHALPILLVATLASAAEPQSPQLPALAFRTGSRHIVIPQRNAEGPHDFTQDSCNAYTIETATLHAAVRRGTTLYVVYSCSGHSRGPEARLKRCGAGWEHQINWIAIRGGIVVDHQQRDIESCGRNASGSIEGWQRTKLVWASGERTGTYHCYFDLSAPEAGLQIQKYEELTNP